MFRKGFFLFLAILFAAAVLMSQDWWEQKPYATWSKDDVTNMLDKSPWGRLFSYSFESVSVNTVALSGTGDVNRADKSYEKVGFHLAFASAQPIRMAIAREALLTDPSGTNPAEMQKFVDQKDSDNFIVVMSLSSSIAGGDCYIRVDDELSKFTAADLKNIATLANDQGKKVNLIQYDPLGANGYGVKLVFPRQLPDGSPLVSDATKELRLDIALPMPKGMDVRVVKINAKWDVKKMVYKGKLDI